MAAGGSDSAASTSAKKRISEYCSYFGDDVSEFLRKRGPWDLANAPSAAEFKDFSSRLSEAFTLVQRYSGGTHIDFGSVHLADVPSAAAGETKISAAGGSKADQRKQFILINNNFMESIFAYSLSDRLNRNTATGELLSGQRYDWPLITVLAHHFAYHLLADGLGSGCHPRNVLRADWYSGKLLRQMKAPLSQVGYLIHQFAPVCGTTTHPSREERLLALVAGYRRACEQDANCNATAVLEDLQYLTSERPVEACTDAPKASLNQRLTDLTCRVGGQELLIRLPKSFGNPNVSRRASSSTIGTVHRRRTVVPIDIPELVGQFIHLPSKRDATLGGRDLVQPEINDCDGLLVLEQTSLLAIERQSRSSGGSASCGPDTSLPTALMCFQAHKGGARLLDFSGHSPRHQCRADRDAELGTCKTNESVIKPPKFEMLCSIGGQQYLVDKQKRIYDRRLLEPGVTAKYIGTLTGDANAQGPSTCQQTLEIPWETVCVRTENPFAQNALRCKTDSIYRMRSLCLNRTANDNISVSLRRDGDVVVGACVSCKDSVLCPGHRS